MSVYQEQASVLLQDVVRFYCALRDEHVRSVDAFERMWEQHRMEYLLHAGSTALVPYHPHIVHHLLSIGETYMSIPHDVNSHAARFGLLWTYFAYFLQPAIDEKDPMARTAVRVSTGTIENVIKASSPVGLDRLLGVLHGHGALHVVPHVQRRVWLRTLVVLHHACGMPLFPGDADAIGEGHDTSLNDDVEAALAEYDALLQELNGKAPLGSIGVKATMRGV